MARLTRFADFPMFEWNEEEDRLEAVHHPFTAPNPDDLEGNGAGLRGARALAYDLVYNGVEVAGVLPRFKKQSYKPLSCLCLSPCLPLLRMCSCGLLLIFLIHACMGQPG